MWCKIIQSTSDCLCFKLGSLYFIKTSISFSLLKKVEKKSSQIFSFFGPKYQNHRHSPQFLDLLKSSWKFSSVLNFHKGQLHCTQYYFFNTAPLSLKQFLQGFYLFTYVPLRNKFFRIFLESLLSLYLGSYVSYVPMHLTCLSGLVP